MLTAVMFGKEVILNGHLIGATEIGGGWGIYIISYLNEDGFMIYAEKETPNGCERVRLGGVVENKVIFDPNATSEFRIVTLPFDPVMSKLAHVRAAVEEFSKL